MNDVDKIMELQKIHNTPKMVILYCTLAGLISALIISGLLEVIDFASGTPSGTFFAVIGLSLGFNDPASAQYIGYGLHILTGTVAGNIFGQMALFWRRLIPYNMKRGISLGLLLGISLWAVLFAPGLRGLSSGEGIRIPGGRLHAPGMDLQPARFYAD